MNLKISNKPTQTPIYLFGAHIFSQFYLKNGLEVSRIIEILDNDPSKQSNRLYGTDLIVRSPEIIKDIRNPVVVLKVGAYKDEIMHQMLLRSSQKLSGEKDW